MNNENKQMNETKTIKTYIEIRNQNAKELEKLFNIMCKEGVFDTSFLVWFINRFGLYEETYFLTWIDRYKKGVSNFLGHMDDDSRELFKAVFMED
jgi:hypothetical protein